MLKSKFVKILMSILKRQVNSSSNFTLIFVFMAHNSSKNFWGNTFYTLYKRIPSKSYLWHSQVLWWKFAKFLMSFFEPQDSFSSNFAPLFSVIKDRALYIFSSKNKYFAQKEPIKAKMFETFECSGQNLSNFLCQFWNDKSIYLQILYPSSASWKITPLYFF